MSSSVSHARSAHVAVVASLALGLGFVVGSPLPTARADAGPAIGPVTTVPVEMVPDDSISASAGTGTRFIREGRYTADNGKTWQDVPPAFAATIKTQPVVGYGGTFVALTASFEPHLAYTGIQRWDPDAGTVTTHAYNIDDAPDDEADGLYVVDYVDPIVVINDGRIFDISGDAATLVQPRFATTPTAPYGPVAVTRDLTRAVRAEFSEKGTYGYLNVAPLRGGAGATAVKVTGLLAMDVSGDTIHYLVGTSARLTLCKAAAATPRKPTCVRVASGDYRPSKWDVWLTTSAGADQLRLSHNVGTRSDPRWFVRGGRVEREPSSWVWLGFRDTAKPMVFAPASGLKVPVVATVSPSGRATKLLDPALMPAMGSSPVLSTGRVTDEQESYSPANGLRRVVWYRSINADGSLGKRVTLTSGARDYAVDASAGRTAVRVTTQSSQTERFYDGTARQATITVSSRTSVGELSGPYAVLNSRVIRVDGHAYTTGPVFALFGSLALEASAAKQVAGRTFQVRDVAQPKSAPIPLSVPQAPGRVYLNDQWHLWGDWAVGQFRDPDGAFGFIAVNFRTGQQLDLDVDDWVFGLGDGFVLAGNSDTNTAELTVLATGESVPLPTGNDFGAPITDGTGRVGGWYDPEFQGFATQFATVTGLPASAPRLLGTLAPKTFAATGTHRWTPAFDLTRPLAAGHLDIRSSTGALVRSLPTTAGPMGSVRGVSWDGRNSAGSRVAAGTYTWTLDAAGSDGSGTAVGIDGLAAATGTVVVSR